MFAHTNLKNIKRFKLATLTPIILLIAGFSILLYTTSAIHSYTQLLLDASKLTAEEMWSYEASLQWWSNTYATVFPIALTMITAGLVSLFGPAVWTRIQQRHAIRTFTHQLELAAAEKFEIK
jgi:hypothetical protein